MSDIYITADTHFHHMRAATEFRPFASIEEHDETIIDRWNQIVNKRDVVYHLGDVAMRRSGIQLIKRLNGVKRLILGNHDLQHKDLFDVFNGKVYGSYILKEHSILMTHIPVHETQLVYRFGFNLHGHIHNALHSPIGKYLNMNTEFWSYAPVPLDIVINKLKMLKVLEADMKAEPDGVAGD